MVTITIKKAVTTTWKASENVITEKTPTAMKDKYDGTMYAEKYAVREVDKSDTKVVTLLEQNIEDDDLDIAAVIKAINGI